VGSSGPTLNAGDALYNAEADALATLAESLAGAQVDVRAIQVDAQGRLAGREAGAAARFRQVIRQVVKGRMEGASIVKVWRDREGRGAAGTREVMYALACDEAGARQVAADGFTPMADSVSRPCALGVAGPTLKSDQQEVAFEDARARLAELLAVDVESILVDYDLARIDLWQSVHSPDEVRARVDASAKLAGYVRDDEGRGPLGIRGVAYALACL
jgi:hypothetical protein